MGSRYDKKMRERRQKLSEQTLAAALIITGLSLAIYCMVQIYSGDRK